MSLDFKMGSKSFRQNSQKVMNLELQEILYVKYELQMQIRQALETSLSGLRSYCPHTEVYVPLDPTVFPVKIINCNIPCGPSSLSLKQ